VSVLRLRAYKGLLTGRVPSRSDFIFRGVIPRQTAARESLDDDLIRFFILKIIFRILIDLCGVRDRLLRLECVAWNFWSSLSSDRVVRKHGWKNVAAARIWIATCCKLNPSIIIATVLIYLDR
jgi:hypothetical protein